MTAPAFKMGDKVRSTKRPEWGVGSIMKIEAITFQGKSDHSIYVRFAAVGVKTLLASAADLIADLDDAIQGRSELDESVSQWIVELAACKYTGKVWNGIDLFMSAMCSPYGDGVELAVYLDDACTVYTASESVYNFLGGKNNGEDGINYLTYAEEFIKSAFSEVTSCLLQEYVDPNDAADEEDAEQEYPMNDYCTAVLEADVADFNNCEADEEAQEGEK